VVKIAELEVVARSQADRIAELEVTCTDFKHEKDTVTDGYRRLAETHKSLAEKVKHDKTKHAEPMLLSSLSFTWIWIWRPTAIQNTARMCTNGFTSFLK
jgi:uncharacterized coiled-coil protein SlyX